MHHIVLIVEKEISSSKDEGKKRKKIGATETQFFQSLSNFLSVLLQGNFGRAEKSVGLRSGDTK